MEIKGKEIIASEGKYIRRIGTDSYFKKGIVLSGETLSSFEEVDSIPPQKTEEEVQFQKETEEKVKTMFFRANVPSVINTMGLTRKEALAVKDLHPVWLDKSVSVKKGERYQHKGKLYEVEQDHTTQTDWTPENQSSLWVEVVEDHSGTLEDPIPYNEELNPMWQGMVLEEGKYYTQNKIVYKCIRGTGNKVTHNLADLISGGFVEKV